MATQFERVKLPGEKLDYHITWKKRLKTDVIAVSQWALLNPLECGITLADPGIVDQDVFIWVMGGIPGKRALLTNTITTGNGRILQYAAAIAIRAD